MEEVIKIVKEIVDQYAVKLVRILCSEVEVLEEQNALTPDLFKNLSKELIYENRRNLKNFLELKLTVGKIIYSSAPKK